MRVLAALNLDASSYLPILADPRRRFVRCAIAIRHDQVDYSVHLSTWFAIPALPAVVDSGESEATLPALRANGLFPSNLQTELLGDFENGNFLVNPFEIGHGTGIVNIVASINAGILR